MNREDTDSSPRMAVPRRAASWAEGVMSSSTMHLHQHSQKQEKNLHTNQLFPLSSWVVEIIFAPPVRNRTVMLARSTVRGLPGATGAGQHHCSNQMLQPVAFCAVEGMLGEKK